MTKTDLKADYMAGFHTRWERELCKALSLAQIQNKEVTHDGRKQIVDGAVRFLGPNSEDIVCCEYCQERESEALFSQRDELQPSNHVLQVAEKYGFKSLVDSIHRAQARGKKIKPRLDV